MSATVTTQLPNSDISYRRITEIAGPIILGGVAQNVISVTDTVFLARLGPVELSASALGGILFFVFSIMGLALATGTQILVARRVGEQRDSAVGSIVDHAIYLKLAFAVLAFVCLRWGIRPLAPYLTPDPAVAEAMTTYLSIRAFEIFAALLFWTARGFYTGIGWTTVVIYATATMAVTNIALDWVLIFGNAGFPRLGIAGAAIASAISESLGLLIMVGMAFVRGYVRRFHLFRFPRLDWALVQDQLRLSGPIVLQNLISIAGWFLFFMLIGYMGTLQLAAANVVRSLYMVALIPAWAFGSASNSLVSNVIGQGKRRLVLPVIRRAVLLGTLVCTALALPLLLVPDWLLRQFAADPAIVAAALPNLPVVAAALVVAGAAFGLLQSVTGTGATGFAFRLEVVLISIYIGYLVLVTQVLRWPQPAVWVSEVLYCVLMIVASTWFLKRGSWRTLTV